MPHAATFDIPELPFDDGEPMDSAWARDQMNLLIDATHEHFRPRTDYYTGGDMFIYFSLEQARNKDFRGPDYFLVMGVDGVPERKSWVAWEEGGHYPDMIMEFLSESTREEDLGRKKEIYQKIFRTPEYFAYDPETRELMGWRIAQHSYEPIAPDADGRLWSEVLGLWLGEWQGEFLRTQTTWIRFFREDGSLVPTSAEEARGRADQEQARAESERARAEAERERAEAERERAEAERERADAAETELRRLRQLLAAKD